jgi:hypothetical protein
LTGVPFLEALQAVAVPPLSPLQIQLIVVPNPGKDGEAGRELPIEHSVPIYALAV